MLKRRIIRKKLFYDFMLRLIHNYYRDKYTEFLQYRNFEEGLCPSISRIDEIFLSIQSSKSDIITRRPVSTTFKVSYWNYFLNIDLEDVIPC